MTIESPLWLQGDGAGSALYPARLDRQLIANLLDEGVLGSTAFAVSQRAAGANFSVDVAAGVAVVEGDDMAVQGSYLVTSTAVENVVVSAAPGANSRYDIVVLRVNDPQAGGAAGDDATLAVIAGTPSASPTPPAVPDSAILLATIGPITPATSSITTGMIADARAVSRLANDVIAAAAVVTTKIADANVTTAKIADGAVTTAKIANANVTTAKIADANVTTAKIADSNVTTAKIAASGVTAAKIADSNVTTAKIADGNVTEAKIADGAVTGSKLDVGAVANVNVDLGHGLATNTVDSAVRYQRVDNMVLAAGYVKNGLPLTIPGGYRPTVNTYAPAADTTGAYGTVLCTTAGSLQFVSADSATTLHFSMCWALS